MAKPLNSDTARAILHDGPSQIIRKYDYSTKNIFHTIHNEVRKVLAVISDIEDNLTNNQK